MELFVKTGKFAVDIAAAKKQQQQKTHDAEKIPSSHVLLERANKGKKKNINLNIAKSGHTSLFLGITKTTCLPFTNHYTTWHVITAKIAAILDRLLGPFWVTGWF